MICGFAQRDSASGRTLSGITIAALVVRSLIFLSVSVWSPLLADERETELSTDPRSQLQTVHVTTHGVGRYQPGRWGTLAIEAASLPGLMQALIRARETPDGPAWQEVLERDGWLLAQREAAEVRAQQRQMGRSLLQLLADLGLPLPGGQAPRLAWPAAWAWAGHCLGVASTDLVEAYLYAWMASQISAAVRLVPIGPTQGQVLQLRLAPLLAERAAALEQTDPRTLWSSGVGAGLAQLGHTELYSRLFRS